MKQKLRYETAPSSAAREAQEASSSVREGQTAFSSVQGAQSGWSMVEMLGVLAIIGMFSI